MSRTDDLRAELELAELEDRLVTAKTSNTDSKKLRKLKDDVRAARQAYREKREAV